MQRSDLSFDPYASEQDSEPEFPSYAKRPKQASTSAVVPVAARASPVPSSSGQSVRSHRSRSPFVPAANPFSTWFSQKTSRDPLRSALESTPNSSQSAASLSQKTVNAGVKRAKLELQRTDSVVSDSSYLKKNRRRVFPAPDQTIPSADHHTAQPDLSTLPLFSLDADIPPAVPVLTKPTNGKSIHYSPERLTKTNSTPKRIAKSPTKVEPAHDFWTIPEEIDFSSGRAKRVRAVSKVDERYTSDNIKLKGSLQDILNPTTILDSPKLDSTRLEPGDELRDVASNQAIAELPSSRLDDISMELTPWLSSPETDTGFPETVTGLPDISKQTDLNLTVSEPSENHIAADDEILLATIPDIQSLEPGVEPHDLDSLLPKENISDDTSITTEIISDLPVEIPASLENIITDQSTQDINPASAVGVDVASSQNSDPMALQQSSLHDIDIRSEIGEPDQDEEIDELESEVSTPVSVQTQLPVLIVKCTVPGCNSIFKTQANMHKHLRKMHHIDHLGRQVLICRGTYCRRDFVKDVQRVRHELSAHGMEYSKPSASKPTMDVDSAKRSNAIETSHVIPTHEEIIKETPNATTSTQQPSVKSSDTAAAYAKVNPLIPDEFSEEAESEDSNMTHSTAELHRQSTVLQPELPQALNVNIPTQIHQENLSDNRNPTTGSIEDGMVPMVLFRQELSKLNLKLDAIVKNSLFQVNAVLKKIEDMNKSIFENVSKESLEWQKNINQTNQNTSLILTKLSAVEAEIKQTQDYIWQSQEEMNGDIQDAVGMGISHKKRKRVDNPCQRRQIFSPPPPISS